jgi:hypothetical protein
MTPTEQAARWLEDVPRHSFTGEKLLQSGDGAWLYRDDVLAAIARLFAPGDDLRLIQDCELAAQTLADTATFETGQSILREAADRISALTATVTELQQSRDQWKSWSNQNATAAMSWNAKYEAAEDEAATLRDRLARMEGALQQINVGYGWAANIARAALTDGGSNG